MTQPTTITLVAAATGHDPARAMGELMHALQRLPGIISTGSLPIDAGAKRITVIMEMPEVVDE